MRVNKVNERPHITRRPPFKTRILPNIKKRTGAKSRKKNRSQKPKKELGPMGPHGGPMGPPGPHGPPGRGGPKAHGPQSPWAPKPSAPGAHGAPGPGGKENLQFGGPWAPWVPHGAPWAPYGAPWAPWDPKFVIFFPWSGGAGHSIIRPQFKTSPRPKMALRAWAASRLSTGSVSLLSRVTCS